LGSTRTLVLINGRRVSPTASDSSTTAFSVDVNAIPLDATDRVEVVGDLAKDRYNFMIVGSYQRETAIFGRDRSFPSSGINENALNDTSRQYLPGQLHRGRRFDTYNPGAPACPGPYAD
jgi:hypothetical protein